MIQIPLPRAVRAALAFVLVAGASAMPAFGAHMGTPEQGAQSRDAVPGEIVVRYRPGIPVASRSAVRGAAGASLVERLPISRVELIDVGDGDVGAAIERLSARDEVLYAEPNFIYRGAGVPNDPRFEELWGMHNVGTPGRPDADIDATDAWDRSTGDPAILVGVVDSGVVADHPDLAPNMWTNPEESGADMDDGEDDDGEGGNGFVDDYRGWDFVAGDNFPDDENGHGTHVAGTIGARGDDLSGVAGVAWEVSLLPIRVLAADNTGNLADIAAGMDYAGLMGARVANVSIQASFFSRLMRDAIAENPDTLYVIAAGNGGNDGVGDNNDKSPTYPCAYSQANIVCVAATDRDDRLTEFSNFGTRTVDLAAPGQEILSAQPERATPFYDFFDLSDDFDARWATGGDKSTWAVTQGEFDGVLEDSPEGRYKSSTNSWATTDPPVDLTGGRNCKLSYDLDLSVRRGDRLIVEGSLDGTTFSRLDQWRFNSHGWIYGIKDDLGATASGASAYYIRFRFKSNSGGNADGATIDNVFVDCISSDYTDNSFAFNDGTSMATPHVAGAAALAFSVAPSATLATVKEALLASVDVRPDLVGVVKSAGRLNVDRTLAILTEAPGDQGPEVVCVPDPEFDASAAPRATLPATVGADAGEFTTTTLDGSTVFDQVDAAFGPSGLHVLGATGDNEIRYFEPSGSSRTVVDVDLTHSGVALGVRGDDEPVIGYHDRLVAGEEGVTRLCEANMVATGPVFDLRVADVVPAMDGSFASFDLAVDPSSGSVHRVFARGTLRELHYATGSVSEDLGLKKVDDVKVAASGGQVVVGALAKGDLHLFSGGWTESVVAHGVRSWDVDIGSNGKPRAVWTNGKGKLRLFNGRRAIKLDWRAAEVSIAAGTDGTLHVAVGTDFPHCKGFGCGKVGYLQKATGSPVTKTKLKGRPGYVTSLAIAVTAGEVAIVYGDPANGGALVVSRAVL